jgi:hypothetical protein
MVVEPSFWSYFWIIIVLGGLCLALYLVKRFKFRLNAPSKTASLLLVDHVDVGDGVKAVLLEADGQTFLCVVNRNSCSNLCPVDNKAESDKYDET